MPGLDSILHRHIHQGDWLAGHVWTPPIINMRAAMKTDRTESNSPYAKYRKLCTFPDLPAFMPSPHGAAECDDKVTSQQHAFKSTTRSEKRRQTLQTLQIQVLILQFSWIRHKLQPPGRQTEDGVNRGWKSGVESKSLMTIRSRSKKVTVKHAKKRCSWRYDEWLMFHLIAFTSQKRCHMSRPFPAIWLH